jgi:hypothetical protein
VPERVGTYLTEALDYLAREARDALEWEIRWNATVLVLPRPRHITFLASQIPVVLNRRFDRRHIDICTSRIDLELGDMTARNKVR